MNSNIPPKRLKFSLGRMIVTDGAREALSNFDIVLALVRHGIGDWGDLDEEDLARNERALISGGRLVSVHSSRAHVMFYVITESDRSTTTVLLAHEY